MDILGKYLLTENVPPRHVCICIFILRTEVHFRFFLYNVKEKNIMKSCANTYLRSGEKTEEGKYSNSSVFAEFLYNQGNNPVENISVKILLKV